MALDVLLQQHLLIETAATHCALEPKLLVHLTVLLQVGAGQELFITLATGKRKVSAVILEVLLELALLCKLFRAVRTLKALSPLVTSLVGVQLTDLGESSRTLVAHEMLRLVV